MHRFVVVAGTTAILLHVFKPPSLFDDKGNGRKWSITRNDVGGVPITWAMLSLFTGAMSVSMNDNKSAQAAVFVLVSFFYYGCFTVAFEMIVVRFASVGI